MFTILCKTKDKGGEACEKNMVFITWLLIWMLISSSRSRERYHEDVLRRVNYGKCVSDFMLGVNFEHRLGPSQAPIN